MRPLVGVINGVRVGLAGIFEIDSGNSAICPENLARLILGEGLPGYLLVVFIGVSLLFIPKIGVPLDFGCLFLFYAAIALDMVRLVRWRRQYETSISRLFQSASGCENPLESASKKQKEAWE